MNVAEPTPQGLATVQIEQVVVAHLKDCLVGIIACDSNWNILWRNARATEMFGGLHNDASVVLRWKSEKIRPAAEPDIPNGLIEMHSLHGPGRWVLANCSSRNGMHIVHFMDAGEIAHTMSALTYQESIWRNAIESAGHGVWDYNADNEALFHSPLWKQMRGFPVDQPVNDTYERWLARLHPDDADAVIEHVRKHNAGEIDQFAFEYREKTTDGNYIWILASGRVVEKNADGVPMRLLGTDIDITKIKEAEIARRAELDALHQQHILELEEAQQRTEAARQVAHVLARQDALTQLPNRRVFSDEIEKLTETSGNAPPFAVLIVDLDRFKPVNDLYGHITGDLIIQTAAARLLSCVGADGIAARLGGDEFGIILHAHDGNIIDAAERCAENIIDGMGEPIQIGGFTVEIGASVGVAIYPDHGTHPSALFRNADMALYSVKQARRGTFSFYCADIGHVAEKKAKLESAVRRAVIDEECVPFFQPIVDIATKKITTLEILARWNSPSLGKVQPDHFIPIIDQFNLMPDFTRSMLLQACAAAAEWPEDIALSVNLTAKEVCDLSTPMRVFRLLADTGFPAARLKVEVTEQALMHDMFTAKQVIAVFRNAGVRVSLDDFGAGYAGLGYLRELKFDSIKIDRSFVATLLRQGESRKIVEAMQTLARNLNLETVAEGVEDQVTLDAIKAIGCTCAQGYFFSPAVPALDVPRLLSPTTAAWRKQA